MPINVAMANLKKARQWIQRGQCPVAHMGSPCVRLFVHRAVRPSRALWWLTESEAGKTNGQMYGRADRRINVRTDFSCILQNFVPLETAAQKRIEKQKREGMKEQGVYIHGIRCVLARTDSNFGQKQHFCMVSTRV